MSPEIRPKSFGTFEKRAPEPPRRIDPLIVECGKILVVIDILSSDLECILLLLVAF